VRVARHGVSVDLPKGWEGRIFRRGGAGPVMQIATFPLLPSDGDYGAAATGRMRGDDAFAALLEFRPDPQVRPGVGLFEAIGRPALQPHQFQGTHLQVTRPGQLGCQRFFTDAGRALCLYAVVQPLHRSRTQLIAELHRVLATIELAERGR
jgi:hypothetical protein